jgi:hypothetical protein
MAQVKAATLIYLRTHLRERGNGAEEAVLAKLPPGDVMQYKTALAMSWIPMEMAARLYPAGVAVLFPSDSEGLKKLGAAVAKDNFTTVYKVLLRLATIPFLIDQTARVWRTYHQQGTPRVERVPDANRAVLHVEGYPDLLPPVADVMSGYIMGLAELSGARNPRVEVESQGGGRFRWTVAWD